MDYIASKRLFCSFAAGAIKGIWSVSLSTFYSKTRLG